MTVSSSTLSLSLKLNKLIIFSAFALFVVVVFMFATYFYYSDQYKKTSAESIRIKNDISTLENSEQKLVLAKDRLQKIQTIKSLSTSDQSSSALKYILETLNGSTDSVLTELNLINKKIEISFSSQNSSSMSSVTSAISGMGGFKDVVISSITYNSSLGYVTNMKLNTK